MGEMPLVVVREEDKLQKIRSDHMDPEISYDLDRLQQ